MSLVERPVLTGARWSEASRCSRMAVYTAKGVMGEAPGPRLQGLYERGHDVESAWVRRFAEGYSGSIVREAAIPWGDGCEAHVDVILPDEADRPHIEVKSTTSPDQLPGVPVTINGFETTSAVIQVAGGALFDPEGGSAEVIAISPVDYSERRYPIELSDELQNAVAHVAGEVTTSLRNGHLPARSCRTPGDAQGKMCPHAAHCFADWQPQEDAALPAELEAVAGHLAQADADVRILTAQAKQATEARNAIRAQLRPYIPEAGAYQAGRVQVKLSGVKERESFDLSAYRKAGHTLPADLAGWVKVGEPGERWSVTIIDDMEDTSE